MNELNIKNLSFNYKKKIIFNNFSLCLKNGLIGLVGPNGAGKTTLLKLICTLYEFHKGEINFNEYDYRKDKMKIRKNIGYLPQNFDAYPQLTGEEFLEYILSLKYENVTGNNKKEMEDIIEKLQLKAFIKNKIKTYSGGMKQRLGIAQALIGNPKLIIADEPTTGLDPETCYEFRELLYNISRERILILSTHIIKDIEDFCDELIMLENGKKSFQGSVVDFMELSKGKLWIDYLDFENYQRLKEKSMILSSLTKGKKKEVKYVLEDKFTSTSKEYTPTLDEAYMYFRKVLSNSEKESNKQL